MNPFHSSPNYNSLFLQQLPPTCSRPMVLKRSKLQPGDIPLPLLEAKSSLSADFQQRFDDNLSSESRHRKNLFIQSSPGNECKRKCYPTTDLWIHRYTKRYSRKAISPLPLSSPFSSIQHLKTNG